MFQFSDSAAKSAPFLGPAGLRLLWQALGAVFIVHALPRFLLSAFGAAPRPLAYRLLEAATAIVLVLSAIRITTGWEHPAAVAELPNTMLRIFLYVFIGASLAAALVFQSRLPDRILYKAVIAQIGAFTLLFFTTSVSAALHARKSLKRSKYVADNAPSSYFVERFGISIRELEIVSGVVGRLSNNEIGEKLFISPRTVEKHPYNIYQKAGIKNRLQLFNLLRSDAG